MGTDTARLLIVLEQGDYRAALQHIFDSDNLSDQLSQRVSPADLNIITAAAQWGEQLGEVAIFSNDAAEPYSYQCYLNIQLLGGNLTPDKFEPTSIDKTLRLIADFCPTHIVLCTPAWTLIRWTIQQKIPLLPLFSKWEEPLGKKQQQQHKQHIKLLNHPQIEWVGIQGVYACKVLETSGISSRKLIPWSWSNPHLVSDYPPKQLRCHPQMPPLHTAHTETSDPTQQHPQALNIASQTIELLHLGPSSAIQDIDDSLTAVKHLQDRNLKVRLKVISEPEAANSDSSELTLQFAYQRVHQLNITEAVTFLPPLSKTQLLKHMRAADLVIIPGNGLSHSPALAMHQPASHASRPSLQTQVQQTLPQSLFLALSVRTPIIAADLPDFSHHLAHGINAMIFPAGNAKSMAHRIERIMGQPQLYNQLSAAAEVALSTLKVPARWAELIGRWISSNRNQPMGADNYQWLCNCAFSSGRYPL